MRWSTSWACLLLAALTWTPVQRVTGCSCMLQHPQNLYCTSDFVVLVKVIGVNEKEQLDAAYKVRIHKVFKSSSEAKEALESKVLWTPNWTSLCGVNLDMNKTYVIGGEISEGKAKFSLCGLVRKWSELEKRERVRMSYKYPLSCACKVSFARFSEKARALQSAAGKSCIWENFPGPHECQEKHGLCMPLHGLCTWLPSYRYNTCIASHQNHRMLKKARKYLYKMGN